MSLAAPAYALARSTLVWAGTLLFLVGVGDTIAGRVKMAQYEEVLRKAPAREARSRPTLFPTATEGEERRAVAAAKLGFYRVLFTVGKILTLAGVLVLAAGIARVRWRPPPLPASH